MKRTPKAHPPTRFFGSVAILAETMQLPVQARGLSFHPAFTKMTIAEPPYRPGLANARLANAGQVAYSQSARELLPSTDAPIAEQPHPPRPLRSLTIAKTMTGGMKPTSMIKHATSAPSFNATSKICQETRASRLAPAGRRLPSLWMEAMRAAYRLVNVRTT